MYSQLVAPTTQLLVTEFGTGQIWNEAAVAEIGETVVLNMASVATVKEAIDFFIVLSGLRTQLIHTKYALKRSDHSTGHHTCQILWVVISLFLPVRSQAVRSTIMRKIRSVAQMVARVVRDDEVAGSSPVTPTLSQLNGIQIRGGGGAE